MNADSLRSAMRRGYVVIVFLAVLTAIEFVIAVAIDSGTTKFVLLSAMMIGKTWLIIEYFMHLSKSWKPEGEGEH